MGAQQSSGQGESSAAAAPAKTCYYELLGVDREAGDDVIKKAYRRKALELHPDRNINDVQTATRKFAEVQTAYEILSDPQERAWYDSHRETILSGGDGTDGGAEPTTFRNVRLTSTEEILGLMRKFNATIPFDDEPTGFYGISWETFEHLALEEEAAAEAENIDCPDYPTFGSADDDYDTVVRAFYAGWSGFSTKKTFSWKDKYRLSDAPDRRVRRAMEKENKKCRDDAAREFNDAVRFLVTFVRKRDPRYLPNTQSDADRQKSLRDAAAAQAARSRAANMEKLASYQVPEWARPDQNNSAGEDFFSDSRATSETASELEVEVLECAVCDKVFKSDKQLEAHERSKKHIKALNQLRWQMRKEGVDLDIDDEVPRAPAKEQITQSGSDAATPSEEEKKSKAAEPKAQDIIDETDQTASDDQSSPATDEDDDYAPRSAVADRLAFTTTNPTSGDDLSASVNKGMTHASSDDDDDDDANKSKTSAAASALEKKVGKARAKREKKAAAAQKAYEGSAGEQAKCSVCSAVFDSRTKLFVHIRDEGHAAPVAVSKGASGGKKKSKKRP